MKLVVYRYPGRFVIDSGQLLSGDLVLARNGCFYALECFPSLNWQVNSPPPSLGATLGEFCTAALFSLGIFAFIDLTATFLSPAVNRSCLSAATRAYIRERDDEICFYCGIRAKDGHVDHRISRKNGGGNEDENLAWTCVTCNCTKGGMNDYEFIERYELV